MMTLNPFNDDVQVNTRKAFRAELAQSGCHCSWNQPAAGFYWGGSRALVWSITCWKSFSIRSVRGLTWPWKLSVRGLT